MKKYLFFRKYPVHFFIVLLLSAGCNNDKEADNAATPEPVKTAESASQPPPVTAGLTAGILDTLWITATDFKKLDKNKALFIFYFGNQDTVSLNGWKDKGGSNQFNTNPDVRLTKGRPDQVLTYGPGTYFGNLVLTDVNQLINKINSSNAVEVIFAPQKLGSHVYYKIYLSTEPHMVTPKIMPLIDPNAEANPSPPKNAS